MPEVAAFTLTAGTGTGRAMQLGEPLSFWGGVDRHGDVIDVHHEAHGTSVTGRVMFMTSGRGSSSSAYLLGELIRTGVAPAAIVLTEPDGIIAMGVLAAAELYGRHMPFVTVTPDQLRLVPDGAMVSVEATQDRATIRW
jgi:predicted aconitase with swiveling domain